MTSEAKPSLSSVQAEVREATAQHLCSKPETVEIESQLKPQWVVAPGLGGNNTSEPSVSLDLAGLKHGGSLFTQTRTARVVLADANEQKLAAEIDQKFVMTPDL